MRKTLAQIKHNPTPRELYLDLTISPGWPYKTNKEAYLKRDRALAAILYLGDFRIAEALPMTKQNFQKQPTYLWVKDIKVGKKRKLEYREAKFPITGERACFTKLILDYLDTLEADERLFPWSLKVIKYPVGSYFTRDKVKHERYSFKMMGTYRAWQIINALLPDYTEHWLRAFGYNFDYDNMDHDIMAVSDKTKADPRSLQPYLRRRYEKYPVR